MASQPKLIFKKPFYSATEIFIKAILYTYLEVKIGGKW